VARAAVLPVVQGAKSVRPGANADIDAQRRFWADAFVRVRAETEARAAPLSVEVVILQYMPESYLD
jgi:hypothetical protein